MIVKMKNDLESELEDTKKVLRALLLSVQGGLTPNELCSEYYAMTGKVLEYKKHGCNSAIDMFKDMPDVMEPRYFNLCLVGWFPAIPIISVPPKG